MLRIPTEIVTQIGEVRISMKTSSQSIRFILLAQIMNNNRRTHYTQKSHNEHCVFHHLAAPCCCLCVYYMREAKTLSSVWVIQAVQCPV